MNIYEKLTYIQSELKAPKSQYNNFGKYNYRNCEDILEAVKPILLKYLCTLTITDEIISVNDRIYVKATATLTDAETEASVSNSANAREEENKKGMDSSQVTGSTSSYARKYALNGLFAIDDTKDADTLNKYTEQDNKKFICEECGAEIKEYTTKTNRYYSAEQMYEMSRRKNGKALCLKCADQHKNKTEKELAQEVKNNE